MPFTVAGGTGLESGGTVVTAGVDVVTAGVDALVAGGVWLGGVLLHAHVSRSVRSNKVEYLNMLVLPYGVDVITFPMFLSRSIRLKLARSVLITSSSRFRNETSCPANIACTSFCCVVGAKSPELTPPAR